MISGKGKIQRLLFSFVAQVPFYAIIIFPILGSILLLSRKTLFNLGIYLPYIIVVLFSLSLVLFLILKFGKTSNLRHRLIGLFLIFIIAFFVRYYLVNAFQTPPASDSYLAYEIAMKWINGPHYSFQHFYAQHWGIYSLLLSKVFLLFGASLMSAKMLAIIAASVTAVVISQILYKITDNFSWALLGGALFAIWPSSALYSNIFTGEHLFILFFTLSLLFITHANDAISKTRSLNHYYFYFFIFSISLSLANIFKETSIITVPISITATILLISLTDSLNFKKKIIILLSSFLIIFGATLLITDISDGLVSKYAMGPVDKYKTGYFVATGLNIENKGRFNEKIVNLYREPIFQAINEGRLNESVYQEADRKTMSYALKEANDKIKYMPKLFTQKFNTAWSNEDEINNLNIDSYGLMKTEPANTSLNSLQDKVKKINLISNLYFLAMMILSGVGCVYFIKESKYFPAIYISALTIFGYSLALMVIEIQTHYRIILHPLFTILASVGIMTLYNYLKKRKKY